MRCASVTMVVLAAGLALPAAAQLQGKPATENTGQAIAAIGARMADGLNRHDPAALAALYAEDAVLVTPFGQHSGRPAIERSYAGLFRQIDLRNYRHVVDEMHEIADGWAWAVGHFSDTAGAVGRGDSSPGSGYWSTLFERQGGAWKIRMNSWTIAPPALAASGSSLR